MKKAKQFNKTKEVEALISFEKGEKINDVKNSNRLFTRNFLLKLKHETGEEHFWKYLAIRLKEAEEDNDLRNYILFLVNCKPDIRKMYKIFELEEKGNELFREFRAALKRLGLERAPLHKISKYFETVEEIPKIS